ncbi:MAG: superoxide dismutase [Bacteroidota bacterium]
MAFELPKLPYDYDALTKSIDEQTMRIHHTKHHQGYTDKLNKALESATDMQGKDIEDILKNLDSAPESVKTAIRNNGGGYYNHKLFWEMMTPKQGDMPENLKQAIERDFGSVDDFKEKFQNTAAGQFGSGWGWLTQTDDGKLHIGSTPNQDSPLMKHTDINGNPLLGVDVWEHAYYLKYQNERGTYLSKWWDVVNWDFVAQRLK